jgi:hypothetical protein
MFTYKFLGLSIEDAPTAYYYGSLPAKPEPGHILVYDDTGNRYTVVRIEGEGLVGDGGYPDQKELAWTDIGQGKTVPMVWVQKLDVKERLRKRIVKERSRTFDAKEMRP